MTPPFRPRPAPALRQRRILFERGSYAAFPHVVRLEGDELLLAFRQAPRSDGLRHTHPRSLITVIRSPDRGATWDLEAAAQLAAGGGQELGLIYLGGGRVGGALTAHEVVPRHEAARGNFRHPFREEYPWFGGRPDPSRPAFAYHRVGALWCWSDNYGLTWRIENVRLVGDHMAACAPPLRLHDGTLLLPASGALEPGAPASSVLYRSADAGVTWSPPTVIARASPETRDYHEPALLEVAPGHLLCLHRVVSDARGPQRIFWCNRSSDAGRTWSEPRPTPIRSGACPRLLRLSDGRLLLSYGRRLPPYGIYASLSEDGGASWSATSWLLRPTPDGDQGYTSSLELEPGRILTVSYARDGRGVTGITGTFWKLP